MATAAQPLVQPPVRPGLLRGPRTAERFAWAVVAWNVIVVLWGAFVRATGSGDGCGNNWPLCNGQVIPVSPTLHTIIEFTHRQTAAVSTVLVVVLITWVFRATAKASAARLFAVISGVLLLNEAFLGAILVKAGYVTGNRSLGRMIVLSIHLSNTLLLLAALTLVAHTLGTAQRRRDLTAWSKARGIDLLLASVGLLATLIVGVSGSLAALGDTLFPSASLRAAFAADLSSASPMLLRLRGIHPASAIVAAAFIVWLILRAHREGRTHAATVLLGLLALQFILGTADVLLLAPTWMQILHLLGADLYWIALVAITAGIVWPGTGSDATVPGLT